MKRSGRSSSARRSHCGMPDSYRRAGLPEIQTATIYTQTEITPSCASGEQAQVANEPRQREVTRACVRNGTGKTSCPQAASWEICGATALLGPAASTEYSSHLGRRASRALRLVSRRPRSRRLSGRALACAALRLTKRSQHRAPGLPTALPPTAPPSFARGTCGGISIRWAGKLAHRFGC